MVDSRKIFSHVKVSILQFPGSNCDQDCARVFQDYFGAKVQMLWHTETSLPKTDLVIIPGGFSYGDYLRSGALAARSPIMREVNSFAQKGGYILGICNGFQILTEAKLLPGVLLKNQSCRFVCTHQKLRMQKSLFLERASLKVEVPSIFSMPIAHGDGRYFADASVIEKLKDERSIVFTYEEENPNGSLENIAGICDSTGRIVGMMPHPERAVYKNHGSHSEDGASFLKIWLERI